MDNVSHGLLPKKETDRCNHFYCHNHLLHLLRTLHAKQSPIMSDMCDNKFGPPLVIIQIAPHSIPILSL